MFSLKIVGQSNQLNIKDKNLINRIEELILNKKLDSVSSYSSQVKNKNNYLSILLKISSGKKVTYKEQEQFINEVSNRNSIDYNLVASFINKEVAIPKNKTNLNLDYVFIKINQITRIRNEGDLDKSSALNEELLKYIDSFDSEDEKVILAKAHASFHNIVMHLIQNKIEKGVALINENIKVGEKYNDKALIVKSLYHLCDFLLEEGKLQEYIDASEQSLSLEKEIGKKTEYHLSILIHLIDAYLHKGGHEERVEELLAEIYNNPETRPESYSLYAKYLSVLDTNSPIKKNIFEKFKVNNTVEFAKLADLESKEVLTSNNYYYVLYECANALEKDGFLKEALDFQRRGVLLTRKIYSEDLSKSLANFETEQAVKIKNIEIESERKRTTVFTIAAVVSAFLFLTSLFFLVKSSRQSKTLKEKNKIIDKALKEKELLVKEVHHRVKNNFQIVSSLLELQSKGIEDEKARELANDGKNRVKSMALIHQRLYQNDRGLIDFQLYIDELVKEISNIYNTDKNVETKIDAKNIAFDIDTAIPLGLIINELITNAYKYAFAKAQSPKLDISLETSDKGYFLKVQDNGVGIKSDFDISKAKSLGLRLVSRLTKQLQGKVKILSVEGTIFEISFKDTMQRKMVD